MRTPKQFIENIVPDAMLSPARSLYHRTLAELGNLWYGHPSRALTVIGVTGTKGKTTVTELLNAIFEEAGKNTALLNSIRIKTGANTRPNEGRSMPGRLFIQHFLDKAVRANADVAILEMTSEGARQHRHRGIDLDALVFTNLAPEHIESHGSLEAYADAKFELGRQLARSVKRPRIVVANADDPEGGRYLTLPVEYALPFSLSAQEPCTTDESGGTFSLEGVSVKILLPGVFSLKNAIAAAVTARAFGVSPKTIANALGKLARVPGRAERIDAGQDFLVVVDYAHTPDSLKALYEAYGTRRKICVLSATGGGRDAWKRPVMGRIAEDHCEEVILTDEDPYDEDPQQIVSDIAHGMSKQHETIMDRREAIHEAVRRARTNDAVLITGKGTDAFLHGAKGKNVPWSDAETAREALKARLSSKAV